MIDDDVITRLVEFHDHIEAPAPDPGADALRGKRLLRRRRTMLAGAAAAAVVVVLGVVAAVAGGPLAGDRIEPIVPGPTPHANESPGTDAEWPPERIRAEGGSDMRTVLKSGITTTAYSVCDSPPDLEPHYGCDSDIKDPWTHVAIEVTQDGRSALFPLSSLNFSVQEFDKNSVFVMDDPFDQWGTRSVRYRVLRADGSEVELHLRHKLVPAVPGPDLIVVDYDPGSRVDSAEDVYLVDLRQGTLTFVDVPHLGPDGTFVQHRIIEGLDVRQWGPNVDEFLWFADRNCTVQWAAPDGTFTVPKNGPECADGWDPPTYLAADMFPDGWLQPGRLALLERNHGDLFVHVSLDYGDTWQRLPVTNEAAVPDVLRQVG